MNIAAKETAITPDVRMSKVFVFIFYYNLLRLTGKTKNSNITIAKKRPNQKELFKYLFLLEYWNHTKNCVFRFYHPLLL